MSRTVDKQLVEDRFRRGLGNYARHAEVQASMARRLIGALERLHGSDFPRTLEIGCGGGTLTRLIAQSLVVRDFYANDLVADCRDAVATIAKPPAFDAWHFIAGDIETGLELPARLDLVVSNASFQWMTRLDRLLSRLAGLLNREAALAFTTFGPDNLREIRDLTGEGLNYPPRAAIEALVGRDFHLQDSQEDVTVLRFPSPLDVLRHLRGMGVNALRRRAWQRATLERFAADYRERWGEDDSVPLTYHPMIFIAEKR